MKTKVSTAFSLFIVMLFIAGCSLSEQGTTLVKTVSPGTILFADDFSNKSGGWGLWNQGNAVVDYREGGLRILVQEKQYDFWSVAGRSFKDVQIEVDLIKLGGPDDNDFGLICRFQDQNNFYIFLISSDGYYGIAKVKDGQYSLIGADQLQYHNAIAHGAASNHLRADCAGPALRLYVNGQKLQDVQDLTFTSGDVGLMAGSYDEPGVDILFHNFVVKQPE